MAAQEVAEARNMLDEPMWREKPATGAETMTLHITLDGKRYGEVTIAAGSRGGLVRVVIEAPLETRILRSELISQDGANNDGANERGTDAEQRVDGGGNVQADARGGTASDLAGV